MNLRQYSTQSINATIERAKLFDPRHSRNGGKKRKATGGRTWTVQVICLADSQQTKIPNSSEKQVLHNAGLGLKKNIRTNR